MEHNFIYKGLVIKGKRLILKNKEGKVVAIIHAQNKNLTYIVEEFDEFKMLWIDSTTRIIFHDEEFM